MPPIALQNRGRGRLEHQREPPAPEPASALMSSRARLQQRQTVERRGHRRAVPAEVLGAAAPSGRAPGGGGGPRRAARPRSPAARRRRRDAARRAPCRARGPRSTRRSTPRTSAALALRAARSITRDVRDWYATIELARSSASAACTEPRVVVEPRRRAAPTHRVRCPRAPSRAATSARRADSARCAARSVCSIASRRRRRRQQRLVDARRLGGSDEGSGRTADARGRAQVGDRLVEHRQHLVDFVPLVVVVAGGPVGERPPRAFHDRQPRGRIVGRAPRRSRPARSRRSAARSRSRPASRRSAPPAPTRRTGSSGPSRRGSDERSTRWSCGSVVDADVGIEKTTRSSNARQLAVADERRAVVQKHPEQRGFVVGCGRRRLRVERRASRHRGQQRP